MSDGIPVLIPLGTGSFSNDLELRLLLRSIDTHLKNRGTVYLITVNCPNWVNQEQLKVVPIPDRWQTCKDANLWEKVVETLRMHKIGQFIFSADDNLIMQDVDADKLPMLYNPRGRDHFRQPPFNTWRLRMLNTINWAHSWGINLLDRNMDCHAPQIFDGTAILGRLEQAPFDREPGLCIYTAWRVLEHLYEGKLPEMLPQEQYKWTFQNECAELIQSLSDNDLQSRLFIGYNDGAISGGLLKRLLKIFPEKCIYEKEGL